MPHHKKAYVVHHIPGRIRLRLPEARHDSEFLHDVATRMRSSENVQHVEVNPHTASILVHYQGTIAELLAQGLALGLTDLIDLEFEGMKLAPFLTRMSSQMRSVDKLIRRTSAGEADGATLVIISLLLASAFQLARGRVFGAIPFLWYAGQAIGGGIPALTAPEDSTTFPV